MRGQDRGKRPSLGSMLHMAGPAQTTKQELLRIEVLECSLYTDLENMFDYVWTSIGKSGSS